MSENTNGTSRPNGTANAAISGSLETDIALLTSLLSQAQDAEDTGIEGPELAALLKRLETADGVARGVESRLDDIIGNLDRMLDGLEEAGGNGEVAKASEVQTGMVPGRQTEEESTEKTKETQP